MFYEKITQQELSDMERPDGITPNYTFEKLIIEKDEQGNIIGEYYINLTINKTADEVYQESLVPIEPDPDETEVLTNKISNLESENKLLKAQIQATISNQEFLENCLIEMAMTVYA